MKLNLLDFFQEVPLFNNLAEEELIQLTQICRERTYEKGQAIFYEEDMPNNFYIVGSGQVKIVKLSEDGREHILGLLNPKDFFGEMSLLDGKTRSATAIAVENSKIITICRDDFTRLLRENPDITLKIMVTLCDRLRRADRHVESLAFLSAPGRVARFVMELADEQGIKKEDGIHIPHKMTRQEFANIAGTSRETLTRVLMDFQDEGIISIKKNLLILKDRNKLEKKII